MHQDRLDLPWRFDLVAGRPMIALRQVSVAALQDQFLDDDALEPPPHGQSNGNYRLVNLDDVDEIDASLSGIIFHMTCCGSKLVSNLLRAAGTRVISEPRVIAHLDNVVKSPDKRIEYLRKLLGLYSQIASSGDTTPSTIVIKLSARSLRLLPELRTVYAHLPFVFLTRAPVEIAVSIFRNPRGWFRAKSLTPEYAARFLGTTSQKVGALTNEEFVGQTLGKMCELALPFLKGNDSVSIDYREFGPLAIRKLSGIFPAIPQEVLWRQFVELKGQRDGLANATRFYGDIEEKLTLATPETRVACLGWAEPNYLEILRLNHSK